MYIYIHTHIYRDFLSLSLYIYIYIHMSLVAEDQGAEALLRELREVLLRPIPHVGRALLAK